MPYHTPTATTILARIMAALDAASASQSEDVYAILNARGLDDEPTAGDVAHVCAVLNLSAVVLFCAVLDDLRGVDDFTRAHSDG